MCKIMEDMRNETLEAAALKMLEDGVLSYELIAKYTNLTVEEVKKLAENLKTSVRE